MARFSDRIGITQPPSLARDEMPSELRTALWNRFYPYVFESVGGRDHQWVALTRVLYEFRHIPLDTFSYDLSLERLNLRNWWFYEDRQWWELYNAIAHLAPLLVLRHSDFYSSFNVVFEREGARFRFIEGVLTEITSGNEIAAIEEAIAAPDNFAGAREHIAVALRFLGQRPAPDYRNSISESISAVESTLKVLTGMEHAPLGDALRAFSKAHPIHGALFSGLGSLYGYTSNEHGIRHALIDETANVGFRGGCGFSDGGVSGNLPVQYSDRRTEIHEETKTKPLGVVQGASGAGGDPG